MTTARPCPSPGSSRPSAAWRSHISTSFFANRPNGLPLETSRDLDFDPGGV